MPPDLWFWLFRLRVEYRLTPRWERWAALLVAAVCALTLLAVASPSGSCRYQLALTAGREHWVCAVVGRHA